MTGPPHRTLPTEAPARAMLRPLSPPGMWHGIPAEHLELFSRGDIVSGVLARGSPPRPAGGSNRPALLLVAHDAGASAWAEGLAPVASWVSPALAVAAIDLPLHGQRASAKLSERLITATAALARGATLDRNGIVLVEEFLRQATTDLIRTLDAVLALGAFDPKRVGFLGLGLGAWVGSSMLALEDRTRACVLAHSRSAPSLAATFACGARADAPAPSTDRLTLDLDHEQAPGHAAARDFLASRLGF